MVDGRCKEDGAARAQTSHQAGSLGSGRAVQDIPGSSADGSETGEVKKGQGSQIRQRWSRGKEEGRTGGSGGGDVDDMQREEERRRRDEAEESAGATVEGRGKVKSERGARIGRAVGWQAGWAFGRRAVGGCPISARLEPFLFLPRCAARCAALLLRCVLLCCSASCSAVLAAVEPVTRDMLVQISLRCSPVVYSVRRGMLREKWYGDETRRSQRMHFPPAMAISSLLGDGDPATPTLRRLPSSHRRRRRTMRVVTDELLAALQTTLGINSCN